MTSFRQNRYPFSAAVAPVGGAPMLFNEQFDQGDPDRGNWAAAPGITTAYAGTQFPPANLRRWDIGALMPPGSSSFVDTNRGALAVQSPIPPIEYAWSGMVERTMPPWAADASAFYAQLFTRVALVNQVGEPPLLGDAGMVGVIMSTVDLGAPVDGPFVALGMREGQNGPQAIWSKWSDHATLVDIASYEVDSPSLFLRAFVAVDPEDGVTCRYPEWSIDGFGWQLFGADLELEGEGFTQLTLGAASTGYTDGGEFSRNICGYVDSLQLFGPYPENDDNFYSMRMLTQGGRNWP